MDGVPLLLARRDAAGRLPLVLWFHGFGVDKETHRKELTQLAEAGFLAVGMDAAGHGERRLPDLAERQAAPREQALRTMVGLVRQTADDVPAVIRALAASGLADADRVGAAGVSMGGYVVYHAAVVEPAIRAAVSILGSPAWPEGDGPHRQLDALARTALLSVTAERDENVPPDAARALHRCLAEAHPEARQRYVELPGAVHLMGEADWNAAMEETIGWLREHLGVGSG
jgi:dienelactone hydrolase